jgi:hypothetical protein
MRYVPLFLCAADGHAFASAWADATLAEYCGTPDAARFQPLLQRLAAVFERTRRRA